MAEKDPGFNSSVEPAGGTVLDEPLNLKKRARRRLVGAVALALLAVIVLPMVMDQEPRPLTQDIQIRIPNQEVGTVSALARLAPKPVPPPLPAPTRTVQPTSAQPAPVAAAIPEAKPQVVTKTEPPKAGATPPAEKPAERKVVEKTAEKPAAKLLPQASESARAVALLNSGEQWIVQLGAYQDMANVKLLQGKIKELGYPSFTEKVDTPQGMRVRVRGGPFASRDAAEKAQERLKKIGAGAPVGGVVAQK
ncbi:MAG: SPOR domain-containing protein [Sterolibacterium sp.]|nr:SPOR domain-containing protein [Sterolibacterium sp.]